MNTFSYSQSSTRSLLVLVVFAVAVAAAILFVRSRSTNTLSMEDRVNISALAYRLCKAAAVTDCPIEWGGKDKAFASLSARAGKPLASIDQVRAVLRKPQWVESDIQGGWFFANGKYTVSLVPTSAAIIISPI